MSSKNINQIIRCTQCGWVLDVRAYAEGPVCQYEQKGNIQHPMNNPQHKIEFCATCPCCGATYKGEMPIMQGKGDDK